MKEPDTEMNLKKIMERIKWIRETKAILSKEEISLSIPLMQDLSQVGNIYDKFMSYHAGRNSTMVRKQFIFVILYLYSPSALGGSKMRRGLREKIAKVLGCTCSNVSHDYKNISFYYVTYRSFRNDVNEILDKLLIDLGLKEIGEE
nr:MAG TPA: chromosomal replication initiator protein [Caudoviricetes sp.]